MLNTADLLMSWLTTKRAHILSISLFSTRLNHLLAPLFQALSCAVFSTWKLASYFYAFFVLYFLHPDCLLPCGNLASFSAPLLLFFFAYSPSLLPFFCTMPQGPPGPQGSPHPQPPPPNSMMGPHSQVMLRLSLLSSFLLSVQSYGSIGSQCWCFMLWHSSLLTDLSCIHTNVNTAFIDFHWPESHGTLLFLSQSFMSPRFAGGPRGPPIRMSSQVEVASIYMSHPVYKTALLTSVGAVSLSATRGRSWSSSHAAQHGPDKTTRCDWGIHSYIGQIISQQVLMWYLFFPHPRPS